MEFVYQFSASGNDYSEFLSHYQTRELTQEERMNGMFGERVITFNSLEELIGFVEEVGEVVVRNDIKRDNSFYRAIIIYDDYLE
jgi:hypothetical protein